MSSSRSGFSGGKVVWAPDDTSVLQGVCDLLAKTLGGSHGDRGVATLLALPCSMPNGVVISLAKITDAQRKSLRTALSKCLKKPPATPAILQGLRALESLLE